MINTAKLLREYTELSPEDLDGNFKGLRYEGREFYKTGDVYVYACANPKSIWEFFSNLGETTFKGNDTYLYQDGTRRQFIKSRRLYEFKQYGKVLAILKPDLA